MRIVDYTTYWAYADPGVSRRERLDDFILDMVYFIDGLGVIPPLHVFNQVLLEGGDVGGMGPGTAWEPFSISAEEYQELVETLLKLDVEEAKKKHPYVNFDKVIVDETLHGAKDFSEWLDAAVAKYRRKD